MPPIKSISVADNQIIIVDKNGTSSLNPLLIPSTNITVAENWLNNTYLPGVTNGAYQALVHVFSTNPLKVAIIIADLGQSISATWWSN